MHLYIIRHGESRANAARVYGGAESPLTERGEDQARFVGRRLENISFDAIISSDMLRARQTAEIINEKFSKPMIECGSIHELRRPSELLGVSESDPEFVRISTEIRAHRGGADWRYSDEETFSEIVARGREFLDVFLPTQDLESAVVVSHGTFIRFLIGCMLFGKDFSPAESVYLRRFLQTKNTGITWCELDKQGLWRMHTWMDHAHLG
jgi:probable phosphoglycerate mutase